MTAEPMSIVRDPFGGSACYNMFGGIEEVDIPNFGTVSAYDFEDET